MNACRLILDGIASGLFGTWTLPVAVPALAGWAAALTTADDEPDDRPETWSNGLAIAEPVARRAATRSNGLATVETMCSAQRCPNVATTELHGWLLCGRCYEELAAR